MEDTGQETLKDGVAGEADLIASNGNGREHSGSQGGLSGGEVPELSLRGSADVKQAELGRASQTERTVCGINLIGLGATWGTNNAQF